MDIVGFSDPQIHSTEQVKKMNQLNKIVKHSKTYRESTNMRILPTGDGMVIGFEESCQQPYNLACEISKALNEYNKDKKDKDQIKLRIGLHSGAVFEVEDISGKLNICGNGVIIPQRVMNIGEASHILASNVMGKELKKIDPKLDRRVFKVEGHYRIKHGEFIDIYNIYDKNEGIGNPHPPPKKFFTLKLKAVDETGREIPNIPFKVEIGVPDIVSVCPNCGSSYPGFSKFCKKCGHKIK